MIISIPLEFEYINGVETWSFSPDELQENLTMLDQLDDDHDAMEEVLENYFRSQGIFEGAALVTLAQQLEGEDWYEWEYEVDDDYNPTDISIETNIYVNFEDLVKKIPITFERKAPNSPDVFIMFAGDPLALATEVLDEDKVSKGWEVRSPEFEAERLGGFKDLDEVKAYVQDEVAKLILRPKGSKIPKGLQSSRDYLVAVSNLMRAGAGGKQDDFPLPNREMWVNGPDSDDEYKMMFRMEVGDSTPDNVIESAWEIISENDDEDNLKEIFRTAFAKVAKIKGASVAETKQYFAKFKDVISS